MKRKPIIYEAEVEVRFDDLDSYGHVNSSRYLDYVITSRWKFAQANLSYSVQSLHDRGAGVYLTRSLVRYRRAINGQQNLWIQSFATDVKADRIVVVSFKIYDLKQQTLHSDGEIDFSTINVETQQPMALPPWMLDYLFYPEPKGPTN